MAKETRKSRFWLFLGVFTIIFLITLLLQPQINVNTNTLENAISVSGQAQLEVDPDQAEIYVNIITEGYDAKIVQDVNTENSNSVLAALLEYGLKEENIETTSYYLYPKRTWNPITQSYDIEGYKLTHTMKVTTNNTENVGELINIVVDNGANGIGNIQFTLSDNLEKEVRAEALALAGQEAQAKAENIADSLNIKLGKIKSVSENNYYYSPYTYYPKEAMASGADYEENVVISPEKVTVNSNIAVVYNIK
jgi:hypothetical protein